MAIPARQASPPNGLNPRHAPPGHHAQMNGHVPVHQPARSTLHNMSGANEQIWIQIGKNYRGWHLLWDTRANFEELGQLAEMIGNLEEAMNAYEQALRHNQYSIPAMNQISAILRTREQFPKAIEYLQAILKIDNNNGEVWGSLGKVLSGFDSIRADN